MISKVTRCLAIRPPLRYNPESLERVNSDTTFKKIPIHHHTIATITRASDLLLSILHQHIGTMRVRPPPPLLLGFCLLLLSCITKRMTLAANPFSTNVVALTAHNWKEEVLESPHAVFVNVCRVG